MAKLITRDFGIVTGVKHPKADYSRVVSCSSALPAGGGTFYTWTESVGQNLWLYGVDVWITLDPGGAITTVTFDTFTGFNVPTSEPDIRQWRKLVPLSSGGLPAAWLSRAENNHFHWDMCLLLTGIGRRFGMGIVCDNTNPGIIAASFQIAEG
ncbi:hypothetical protein ES703_34156 [subsurface metagenome]